MNILKRIAVALVTIALVTCKDTNISPVSELPHGRATITDSLIIVSPVLAFQTRVGFNFSRGANVLFDGTVTDTSADVVTGPLVLWPSGFRGYLWSPGDTLYRRAFRFISYNADAQTASSAFHNLSVAPDSAYEIAADSVKANEIWVIQTQTRRFAKILIQEVSVKSGTGQRMLDTLYTTVTFDWVFQPNGSKSFMP